jgi:two-component system CheB/CheR fusion protein
VVGLKKTGQEFPIEASLTRHMLEGRRVLTVVLRDISERRRVDKAKRLVIREISHRLKNLMTVVDSVVTMTARGAESVTSYETLLHERLGAIGRTVDLMLRDDWRGADLRSMLTAELEPYRNADGPTYRLSGLDVTIPPHWALSLNLALHELATNAAKYGAFSRPSGVVSIEWQLDRRSKDPTLQLDWVESGGPAVEPPDRQGFGTDLVMRCVGRSRSHINYARTGLEAHFQVPL